MLLKFSFQQCRHLERGRKWKAECRLGEYSCFAPCKVVLQCVTVCRLFRQRCVFSSVASTWSIVSCLWWESLWGVSGSACHEGAADWSQAMLSPDFFMPSQAELLECPRDFILQWETSHVCAVSTCLTVSVGIKRLLVCVVNIIGYQN